VAGAAKLSEPLRPGLIAESVYGIGTVTARNSFQLRLGVMGTIQRLPVTEGDRVDRGAALVEIDNGVTFSAPFGGTVTRIPIRVGETVGPQAEVLTLVDLTDRYLVVALEQRGAIRVSRGQAARISFENMRERSWPGEVQSVYSSGDAFLVRIGADRLPAAILPGMTADVAIQVGKPRRVLLVPVSQIEQGAVRIAREGKRLTVPVTTGLLDGAMAEVASGDVREGDRLVLNTAVAP
jgi:multidrug efflux pump subunit AcrA (membrane-fusion protein)